MSSLTLPPVAALEKDVKKAAATLGRNEARVLVDTYYQLQDFRIASTNQVRSILKAQEETSEEPHETLAFFGDQFKTLEKQIQSALDHYSSSLALGVWAREHIGIGPVIAAGLLAHIDVTKAPSASSVWRFAGYAPGQKKQKGVKRDWNADLKVLCWKMGDSFVKFSGREDCFYGKLYRNRKEFELIRDAQVQGPFKTKEGLPALEAVEIAGWWFQGGNSTAAAETLATTNFQDKATIERYQSGKLPDGRLDMRARRYAVKRFLLHYWEAAYWLQYGTEPPHPYVQEHLGHVHMEPCPIPYPKP